MVDRIIQIGFFFVPFAFISFGVLHKGQRYGFGLAALAIVAARLKNRYLRAFVLYVCLWQLWVFLSGMVDMTAALDALRASYKLGVIESAQEVYAKVKSAENSMKTSAYSGMTTCCFILFAAVIFQAVAKSKKPLTSFYNCICLVASVQAVLCLFQTYGYDPFLALLSSVFRTKQGLSDTTMSGTLGNPNFVSGFLAISLVFFFRKYFYLAVPVILVVLAFSSTTSAVAAATVACCVYFWKPKPFSSNKWLLIVPFIGLLYASVLDPTPFWGIDKAPNGDWIWLDQSGRLGFWYGVMENLCVSPLRFLFGFGPGAPWAKNFPMHNDWVTVLHWFGLIGFSLVVGYAATIYRGNRRLLAAFSAGCVNMLGSFPLLLAPSGFLMVIIVGLIEREKHGGLSYLCRTKS